MGDIILCSPVIRLLSKQLEADVSFLTKKKYVNLLAHHPSLKRIHVFDENLSVLIHELKREKYDLIIDLHKNIRSYRICRKLGVKSISFNKMTLEKWAMLKLKINLLNKSHIVDRFIECLIPLGVVDDGEGLDFYLPPSNSSNLAIGKRKIAIVAGGTYETKRIPLALIQSMVEDDQHHYSLVGGGDVSEDIKQLEKTNLDNHIDQASWQESAQLIKDADLVISGDTGMMHIAAAFQKPIIVIWGSTSEDFGFAPYYGSNSDQQYISISMNLSCQPCSKYGRETCPQKHMNCLNKLRQSDVSLAIEKLLG